MNINKNWFTISEVYMLFPELAKSSLRVHLKNMIDDGLLFRVRNGIYYIIPFEYDSETFVPDWHLLVESLSIYDHYIGYYSALHIHNLITQPSLIEQIVVNKQIHPANISIRNVRFQYVYHNEKHFFGYEKIWIDNSNKVYCSDLEKTIVDCLFKPYYSCGIIEIGKALYKAQKRIDFEKLMEYVDRFGSIAVAKRLGYLLELFDIQTSIILALKKKITKTIILLDTELPKRGKICSYWGIQQNVETEEIKNSIYT